MRMKRPKAFHCDGYYYHKICPSRGEEDPADIRYDGEGWVRLCRCFCKTRGLEPFTGEMEMCRHCVEHKHLFRAESRELTGRVEFVTPFQVKQEGTAKTLKAWRSERSVRRFLRFARDPDIYGVEVRSGKLIPAERKRKS